MISKSSKRSFASDYLLVRVSCIFDLNIMVKTISLHLRTVEQSKYTKSVTGFGQPRVE